MDEIVSHPVLGDITIRHSKRARRVSIVVKPSGIVVAVPAGVSVKAAWDFVNSKQEWIKGAVERNKKRVKAPQIIIPPFTTRLHKLILTPHEVNKYNIHISKGEIRVAYPSRLSPESDPVQKIIRKAITEAFRIEAKVLLPGRVKRLAEEYGFRYSALSFRNTVSRWGSCAPDNSISLSINLMVLPDYLIDYIILHELCHTVHKNHGPNFHKLLDKVSAGRHYEYRRELKKFTTRWE